MREGGWRGPGSLWRKRSEACSARGRGIYMLRDGAGLLGQFFWRRLVRVMRVMLAAAAMPMQKLGWDLRDV